MPTSNDNFLKIKKLVEFAYNNEFSDFYLTKYQKAGFNPSSDFNSIEDIRKIPFVTKKELLEVDNSKRLFVKEQDVEFLSMTSGTTGKPLMMFYSKPEKFSDPDALSNVDFGRILMMLNPFRSLVAGLSHKRQKNPGLLLIGDIHDMATTCKLASELGVNTIQSSPTIAIILKDYIEEFPDLKKSLKCLLLGGEVMTPAKKEFIKKLYPNLKVFTKYVMSESGLGVDQCHYLAEKEDQIYYHTRDTEAHIELIDPETGQDVELEKEGELIVTSFWNFAMPLIRYKTGDMAIFHKNDCPCKTPGLLFQVTGRANKDTVKAEG
jgi:phenylacetate-CoA ligase